MKRRVEIRKIESEILGPSYISWLDALDQLHGAPEGQTPQEALDNLARSPGVYPHHRAFVKRAANEGREIEER